MSLSLHEQLLQAIERSHRPLIVLGENANADDYSAGFALANLLSKMQKKADIATSGGRPPKALDFFGSIPHVRGDLSNIRKMTISLNSKDSKIDELSYENENGKINIHLIPKTGFWKKEDVEVKADDYKYDLILSVGVQKLETCGGLYKMYADFFYNTPIINIDHSTSNENFGQINIIDINAVATTEILFDLLNRLDSGLIDSHMATLLLTGMIQKTKSFKAENVTPKTLKVASELMALGARREDIVTNLYKTRSVETLRLWGRALARLKSDKAHNLVWTLLTRQDFTNAGAEEESLDNIIEELISTSPEAKVAAIFYENQEKNIEVIVHATRPFDALYLGAPFSASGTREQARLKFKENDIVKAEKKAITHFRNQIKDLI